MLTGYELCSRKFDKEQFEDNILAIEDTTFSDRVFASNIEVFHIRGETKDHIALQRVEDVIKNPGGGIVGIKKTDIENDVLSKIRLGEIVTAVRFQNRTVFIPEYTRSMLVAKTNHSGSRFYGKDLFADAMLQEALKSTESIINITYRAEKKTSLMQGVFSEKRDVKSLLELPEWYVKGLKPYMYSITEVSQEIQFVGAEIKGFVPIIRISKSDTGNGSFKRELCVKTAQSERFALLKQVKGDSIEDALEEFKDKVNAMPETRVESPYQKMAASKKFASIGKKRLATVKEHYDSIKEPMKNADFLADAINLLDEIGPINTTTDENTSSFVGELFMN